MSTERRLFLGLLVFVALRACGVPAPVEAQDDEAMVVARVAFHESPAPIADAPGIYSVLRRGSERHGISLAAYARAYSPRLFAGTSARPWARMLAASCDRPSGYPLPWTAARRDACEQLVSAARALVAGPPHGRCDHVGQRRRLPTRRGARAAVRVRGRAGRTQQIRARGAAVTPGLVALALVFAVLAPASVRWTARCEEREWSERMAARRAPSEGT